MRVEINGNSIRIWGKNQDKHIKIYCNEKSDVNDHDYFSFSICERGFEKGVLPSVMFYKDMTTIRNNLDQGLRVLD